MILYIFNQSFPDSSGFAKRCQMEIDALSKNHEITILCRGSTKKDTRLYESPYKQIQIMRFDNRVSLIERPRLYIPGAYEIYRNVYLLLSLGKGIFTFLKYKTPSNIQLYVVSSPLTVPLISYIIAKLTNIKCSFLEFHDLEPEVAKHIKGITDSNFIVRIEYFLEKWMCNSYNKIVVTSQTQANRIIKRTKQNPTKVFVLPNISNTDDYSKKKLNIKKKYNFNKDDFIVSYSSTLYFDYTITGIIKLLSYFVKISQENPFVKLIIIGGGDGLSLLINKINELNLSQNVICTGKIKHVNEVLANTDVLIIPWEQDSMTETILPTKLFEYMRAKKPIIAPNFGEFRKVLEHNEDSLLYESISDIPKFILLLHKDQKLRSKLAANAYKKCIKYYSNDKYIKDFQDFVSI